MTTFNVPTREEVSDSNKTIFDQLEKTVGFVPNLYATYAHSDNALGNYLNFSNAKTSLSIKEKEVINLAVSQVNDCIYCLSAHTAIAKMNGFTDAQIIEFRKGMSSINESYNVLAGIAKNITENRGRVDSSLVNSFLSAGYTREKLIDTIVVVGDKTISNYIHNLTKVEVDFPLAPSIDEVLV